MSGPRRHTVGKQRGSECAAAAQEAGSEPAQGWIPTRGVARTGTQPGVRRQGIRSVELTQSTVGGCHTDAHISHAPVFNPLDSPSEMAV